MKFFDTKMFYLFWLILFCLILYLRLNRKNRKKIVRLGDADMIKSLMRSLSSKKRAFKIFLKLLAMALIIIALARPKSGLTTETVKKSGIDLIIVLDVSKSMLATDIAPNRFERAKLELLSLIDRLENDRIGLVMFSGTAFMQMPITLDYSAAKLFIKNADIDTLPQPGTAGSAAIDICIDVFDRSGDRGKAIVMFTDGEFHDKSLNDAAKRAKKKGIYIYTVGMGTESGGPIPIKKKGGLTDFKKDKDGNVVLSKMNKQKLFKISEITKGKYFTTKDVDLIGRVVASLEEHEKSAIEERRFEKFEEKFEFPLLLACLMLFLESLISDRKRVSAKKRDENEK
ncbi:VWA domain-containing protein [Thermodesulfobacteriota bacterium]